MQNDFKSEATLIEQLSHPELNKRLISMLTQKISQDPTNPKLFLARANLHRKVGSLSCAHDDFQSFLAHEDDGVRFPLPTHTVSPLGMFSNAENEMPRVMVIDDFLPAQEMKALLAHAQENEAHFRKAKVGGDVPNYSPDKRETLFFRPFEKSRDRFESIAKDKLDLLREGLGVPAFEIEKVELKMTNHVDGGFFKTHSDNAENYGRSGRTISWLYYFSSEPVQYTGGDLYLFDSNYTQMSYASDSFTKVKAIPNRLVAFVSSFYHCVSPMTSMCNTFANGRFAISSHISKRLEATLE